MPTKISCKPKGTPNKAIKVVPGLRPSTGRPCQGAAYGGRYGHI